MFKEFKEFAIKGNAIDLAVGVIVGAAFNQIVNSFVRDVVNPPIGFLTGRVDFETLRIHLGNEIYITYGLFLGNLINFILVAFVIFLIVRQVNRFRAKPSPQTNTKQCPYCFNNVNIQATRCPNCTSQLANTSQALQ